MKRLLRYLGALVAFAVIAIIALRLLFPLPGIVDRPASYALAFSPDTHLGGVMTDGMVAHPGGLTGVVPLARGDDALASRLALIDAAEMSLDLQYYIWHDDVSGILLLDALDQAAKRGVRVRLLLDDNGVPGLDAFMAALNAQANFDIRLFNPSTVRNPKMLGYAFDFFRMNRRMHNKSLIADAAMTIIGGRNIGDEYFQVGEDVFYLDMDAIATGPVVADTVAVFDAYWNSRSVFAVDRIIKGTGDRVGFDARVSQIKASPAAQEVSDSFQSSLDRLTAGAISPEWTQVQVIADDPVKGEGTASRDQLMITRLSGILGDVERRLDLASAYFVPGEAGTAYFTDMAKQGRQVRILTNALNTTDVFLVHAGYSRYRRALLEDGVALYELKSRGGHTSGDKQVLPLGLSGASLHAKTFAVDGERVFIGSFNFDPRSATLNCEMGFIIDSPTMAARVAASFDGPLANVSYQPQLTPEGRMVWREPIAGAAPIIYQQEPGASWLKQIAFAVIGLLPVEWLL